MKDYNFPNDKVHASKLIKMDLLKGVVLKGKDEIKNLPKDRLVQKENHNLHSTVRGFYVPKEKNYFLSYQATEKNKNYGEQINWSDEKNNTFKEIIMKPPGGKNDSLKKMISKLPEIILKMDIQLVFFIT